MALPAAPQVTKPQTAVARMAPLAERLVAGAMALLYLFGAAVQYNDPDPIRWIAIYLAATLVCAGYVFRPMSPLPAVVVGLASLAWALSLAPAALATVPSAGAVATDFQMMSPGVEEFREDLGLLIITVTMGVLALRSRARTRSST